MRSSIKAVRCEYINIGFNRRRFRLYAVVSRDEGAYARLRRVNGRLNGRGAFSVYLLLDKNPAVHGKRDGGNRWVGDCGRAGAMFGKILHETGAVDQIAVKCFKSFYHNRAHYAIGPQAKLILRASAVLEVAIVLLIAAFSMARHTGTKLGEAGHSAVCMAAAVVFLLLGPAPMLLASQMYADFGWTG